MSIEIDMDGKLDPDEVANLAAMAWVEGRAAVLGHSGIGEEEAVEQAVKEFNDRFPNAEIYVD